MNTLKTIRNYTAWFIISILIGMACIKIEIGKTPHIDSESFVVALLNWLVGQITIWIGGIIGIISFVLFITFNLFYLDQKTENRKYKNIIKLFFD